MVEVGTGTSGTRYLRTDWPKNASGGLIAGHTSQEGNIVNLVAEVKDFTLNPLDREGL